MTSRRQPPGNPQPPVPPQPMTIQELRAQAAEAAGVYATSRVQADEQNAHWIATARDPNAPKLDETIEGGAFLVDGRWVNAWGEPIPAPPLSPEGRPIAPGRKG